MRRLQVAVGQATLPQPAGLWGREEFQSKRRIQISFLRGTWRDGAAVHVPTRTETVPYQFVTNQGEGLPSGIISGTTVDVTLANDEAILADESITHNIDIDTDVTSLRIAAAGDDSFGLNDTGIVTSLAVAANGTSILTLNQNAEDLGLSCGISCWAIQQTVLYSSPAVTGVRPDDITVPTGTGTVQFASPVSLAAGSQFTVESTSTVRGLIQLATLWELQ